METSSKKNIILLKGKREEILRQQFKELVLDTLSSGLSEIHVQFIKKGIETFKGKDKKTLIEFIKDLPERCYEEFDMLLMLFLNSTNSYISTICREKILRGIFDGQIVQDYLGTKRKRQVRRYENQPIRYLDKFLDRLKKLKTFFDEAQEIKELRNGIKKYLAIGNEGFDPKNSYLLHMERKTDEADSNEDGDIKKELSLFLKITMELTAQNTNNYNRLVKLGNEIEKILEYIKGDEEIRMFMIISERIKKYISEYEQTRNDIYDFWQFTQKVG